MNLNFFRLAKNCAYKSTSKFRLGAVLVSRRKPISVGINRMRKTHPILKEYNPYDWTIGLHAEMDACLGIDPEILTGAEIYVYRILKDGSQALAKPCSMCQKFLSNVGVASVHYSLSDGYETITL